MAPSINRGIPIPSFGTSTERRSSGSGQDGQSSQNATAAAAAANSSIGATSNILAQWNAPVLMQLDVALQHWFRKRNQFKFISNGKKDEKQLSRNQNGDVTRMTLEDFFALVRKLDWTQAARAPVAGDEKAKASKALHSTRPSKPTSDKKTHPHEVQVRGLNWEERLWHDFICATVHPEVIAKSNTVLGIQCRNQDVYKLHVATGSLELFPHSGDQMRCLLSSSSAATFNKSWSDTILTMLARHAKLKRVEKEKAAKENKQAAAPSGKAVPTFKAIITQGMTVDERVRTRAKAREEQEQYRQKQIVREPPRKTNVDCAWMIQLADALWNHARTLLQRQNYRLPGKLASNSLLHPKTPRASSVIELPPKKYTGSRCVMTFADVIQAISKSRLGQASPTQIAKALTELEGYTHPQKWISVMREYQTDHSSVSVDFEASSSEHDKLKKTSNFHWSKSATTVYITPDYYPAVRSQLTGNPLVSRPMIVKPTVGLQRAGTSEYVKVVTEDTTKSKQASVVKHRKRTSPVTSKNLLGQFDSSSTAIATEKKGPKRSKPTASEAN